MNRTVETAVELVKEIPLWVFWALGFLAAVSGKLLIVALFQILVMVWAPAISHDLKSRYPALDRHRSTGWFAFYLCGCAILSVMVLFKPEFLSEPAIMVPPLITLSFCQFVALGFLAGTISRLELQAELAKPEQVGRNTFGAFLCLFYFPFGGLLLINRRLHALDAATKSHTAS